MINEIKQVAEILLRKRPIYIAIGFFAAAPLLRIMNISMFVWSVGLMTLVCLVSRGVRYVRADCFVPYIAIVAVSCAGCLLNHSPIPYIANSLKALFMLVLIWFLSQSAFESEPKAASGVIDGVCIAGVTNAVWIIIQYVLWEMASIDLNALLFSQVLHLATETSQYKESGLVATGLCWNAGGIAAALLVALARCKSLPSKLIVIVAGLLTQSRTVLIGYIIIFGLFCLQKFIYWLKGLSPRERLAVVVPLCIVTLLGLAAGLTYLSLWLTAIDSSGAAHLGYYTNIPYLISNMNFGQLLVGYGADCSGLPYTQLTGQYYWLDSWFVESDFVNTFLGTGLLGVIFLYQWYWKILRKCYTQNKTIAYVVLALLIMGFFYNVLSVTYYWLVFLLFAFEKQRGGDSLTVTTAGDLV